MSGTLDDLKRLYANEPAKIQFVDNLAKFLQARSSSSVFVPIFNGKLLDVCELYQQVTQKGGYEIVTKDNKWDTICAVLQIPKTEASRLLQSYSLLLLNFEQSLRPRPMNVPGSLNSNYMQHGSNSIGQQMYQNANNHNALSNNRRQVVDVGPSLVEKINNAVRDIISKDPSIVIRGLNFLTTKTYESTEPCDVQLEHFPMLALSLGNLLDSLNPLALVLFEENKDSDTSQSILNIHEDWKCYPVGLISKRSLYFQRVSQVLNDNILLLTVLNIIRNLSLDLCNEQILCYSESIMRHIVSILWLFDRSSRNILQSEAFATALDIILNLSLRVDMSGRRRLQNYAWMEDTVGRTYNRSLLHFRMSYPMSDSSGPMYCRVTTSLLPWIHECLSLNSNRILILKALELLSKLAQVSENSSVLANSPMSFLKCIVDMLCVNVTSLDPLSSNLADSEPSNRYRPPAYHGCNFYSELCDLELRDAAVDAMYQMCTSSVLLQIHFASVPHCVRTLLRISDVKWTKSRSDGSQKSNQILGMMIQRPENEKKFVGVHLELLSLAMLDDPMADIATTTGAHLFYV